MRANRNVFFALTAAAILIGSEQVATAQAEAALQLRVYDVGDLVMEVRDYEYPGSEFGTKKAPLPGFVGGGGGGLGGGGFGGGGQFQFGGGGSNEPRPSTVVSGTTMDDLINVLYSVIDSGSWRENGGTAEAKAFGNSLVVSQTPEVHAQIEQLLKQLRAGAGERKSVTVDARWLLLASDELQQLHVIKNGTQQFSGNGVPLLDREKLSEFTRRATSIRAVTTCFSGQLVYVVSGTKRNVISGYIPVVGSLEDGNSAAQLASSRARSVFRFASDGNNPWERSEAKVGYQPIVEKQNIGALLEIRPTLIQGNEAAIVDLKATVTDSADSAVEGVQPVSSGPPEVDRIAVQSQELATTLRVPLHEPVLVGGMTNVSLSRAESDESPQLYLVLELR